MNWMAVFLLIGLTGSTQTLFAADATASAKKSEGPVQRELSLDAFVRQILSHGSGGRVGAHVAELIGVPKDAPTQNAVIPEEQTTDGMEHLFKVMVGRSPETREVKPIGVVLRAGREWAENSEACWMRVSLDGTLEKVVLIHGKNDEQGKAIKGSAVVAHKDVASPEIKSRFRHEMDFWLKKAYLKKEWRAADLAAGKLRRTEKSRGAPTKGKDQTQ